MCSEKAKRTLGWRPAYTLRAALAETLAWYDDFIRRIRKA
jgi:nucleoside-diphosphate-sugar epimerase